MKGIFALGVLTLFGVLVQSCGTSTKGDLSTLHTAIYTGAGSVWTWSLKVDGTFTAVRKGTSTDTTEELSLSGTYSTLGTGFYKFQATAAAGTSTAEVATITACILSTPTQCAAYGFGIPGVVLMVKPIQSGSEMMVMPVLATSCPSAPLSFSWVNASANGDGFLNSPMWGNATLPLTGLITGKMWTINGTPQDLGGGASTVNACSGGVYTLGGSGGTVTMTDGGVGIVNTDNSSGDIIAFPRDTTVTEANLRNRTFVALVFADSNGGDSTKAVNVTFPATGDGTYQAYTNVETGEVDSSANGTGTVNLAAVGTGEQAGFIKMIANPTSTAPGTMWTAVATLSGRSVFYASGMNLATGASSADDGFAVVGIEK